MTARAFTHGWGMIFALVAVAYLVLGLSFTIYVYKVEKRQDRTQTLACNLAIYTRGTQRDVVRYLRAQAVHGAAFSSSMRLRRFYAQELGRLSTLESRTDPPDCHAGSG